MILGPRQGKEVGSNGPILIATYATTHAAKYPSLLLHQPTKIPSVHCILCKNYVTCTIFSTSDKNLLATITEVWNKNIIMKQCTILCGGMQWLRRYDPVRKKTLGPLKVFQGRCPLPMG